MLKRKVIMVIRDGWGFRSSAKDNAIVSASTPNTDFLMNKYPNVLIGASGGAVGLPKDYQGNSEVGHMAIGSGRIILQSLRRINESISSGGFFKKKEFLDAINNCKKHESDLHIAGLLQEEGVHSHKDHLFALIDLCKQNNFENVKLHLFTDGRDSPVTRSIKYLEEVKSKLESVGFGEVVSICGRYYAMDRDKRWDRTRKAYDCIIKGFSNNEFEDFIESVKESHESNVTDEFIVPMKLKSYKGLKDDDSFIFFNFRTDRPRQLTQAIVESNFNEWERVKKNVFFVAMTNYYSGLNGEIAFKEKENSNLLGEVVSKNGLRQLRISETEKYAHVTFFFNSQKEEPFKGEERILINSPKVATYDLKPEMSAFEVKDALIKEIQKDVYDLIVVNFVNGDMVGHTGVVNSVIKAVETVDSCVGEVVKEGLSKNYDLLIFADHGNVEDQTPEWRTSHTTNPVPFILVSNCEELKNVSLNTGGLQDIAPTVLDLLGLEKSKEMTGNSLIKK